jgi:hypothetical protein
MDMALLPSGCADSVFPTTSVDFLWLGGELGRIQQQRPTEQTEDFFASLLFPSIHWQDLLKGVQAILAALAGSSEATKCDALPPPLSLPLSRGLHVLHKVEPITGAGLTTGCFPTTLVCPYMCLHLHHSLLQ